MAFIPYIIDDFRGGRSDQNDRGVAGSFKGGNSLNIHKKENSLTAQQAMLDFTPSGMSDLGRHIVTGSDGTMYVFGSTGSIFAISGDLQVNLAYSDENGDIKGAAQWGTNDGTTTTEFLFWATSTSIARVPLTSGNAVPWVNATQDFKVTLDPATHHTMEIASGQLNIANNDFIASIDFTGDFDVIALNIRPGNLIKSLDERDDYLIMGSIRDDGSEQGHIWSWVTTAIKFIQKKLIPAKGVNALIFAETPLIQAGTDGELFTSDFSDALPLNIGGGGGQVNPSGVTVLNDMAHFGFYGGTEPGIWSMGRKRPNRPQALNYEYRLAKTVGGSTVSEIGALETFNGVLYATWETTDGSTKEFGMDAFSSTTKATAVYEALEFDNDTPHLGLNYQQIKLSMSPMPSGTSVSAKYKLDKETDFRYAIMGDGGTTHSVSDGAHSTIAQFSIGDIGSPCFVFVH